MRAKTKKKHNMGRRFAIVIGLAATGVMALGTQTGAAATDVVEYDSKVTIDWNPSIPRDWSCTPSPAAGRTPCRPGRFVHAVWHGHVRSKVRKCQGGVGRQVILLRKRPGPDRKLGATRSFDLDPLNEDLWHLRAPKRGRVYAKVTPKVGDGFVCLADYSHVVLNGGNQTRRYDPHS